MRLLSIALVPLLVGPWIGMDLDQVVAERQQAAARGDSTAFYRMLTRERVLREANVKRRGGKPARDPEFEQKHPRARGGRFGDKPDQRKLRKAGEPTGSKAVGKTTLHIAGGGQHPYQQWLDESGLPTPQMDMTIIEQPCPLEANADGAAACTQKDTGTMYLNPNIPGVRETFLHEMGHNYDYYAMDDANRQAFMEHVGVQGPWRDESLGTASPHELFAAAYAYCGLPQTERGPLRLGNLVIKAMPPKRDFKQQKLRRSIRRQQRQLCGIVKG